MCTPNVITRGRNGQRFFLALGITQVNNNAKQPNASPDVSQRNMVALGNFRVGFALIHVHFISFVHFFPALLPNANAVSGGLRPG